MIEVRRSIGPASAKLIKTVPGRGYLFNGEVQERISGGKGSFLSEWSIAVLAFKHIAGERDESLELGIADALIIKLSSLRQLTVRSTIAVRKDADPLKVGQKLGVRAVLTGSILRSGKRLRITGQLLETEHGTLLWADKFDQTFTYLFSVQDSICERVAAGLESTLLGREPEPLVKRFHA
jgi:TolB-like protein